MDRKTCNTSSKPAGKQITSNLLTYLVEIIDENEELVNIFDTHWYKAIKKTISPGDTLRIYRQNFGLTQAELGQKLGKFTRQKISDMENNKPIISKAVAKKLSKIFDVQIDRFL